MSESMEELKNVITQSVDKLHNNIKELSQKLEELQGDQKRQPQIAKGGQKQEQPRHAHEFSEAQKLEEALKFKDFDDDIKFDVDEEK